MKLTDLIYKVSSAVRDATNLVRYPFQVAAQKAQNYAQARLEGLDVPSLPRDRSVKEKSPQEAERLEPSGGRRLPGNALATTVIPTTHLISLQKADSESLAGQKIIGRRGKYQIETLLEDSERVYQGTWLANNASVCVKEYVLTGFNQRELNQVKEMLERLDSVSFKSGGVQDFRLIIPWDTAIDLEQKRGFIITKHTLENHCRLRQSLDRLGAMPPKQVRQILAQVLQTLLFLHNHTIRFADGSIQRKVPHGNLSLDSLWLVPIGSHVGMDRQFYIYVSDLALWKLPFQAPTKANKATLKQAIVSQESITQTLIVEDLLSLGTVGFYLLVGALDDSYPAQYADPNEHPAWDAIADAPLKQFIRCLLGLDKARTLSSAEAAYRELLALPQPAAMTFVENPIEQNQTPAIRWSSALLGLLLLAGFFGIISALIWWLRQSHIPLLGLPTASQPTSLESVPSSTFATGEFGYAVDGDMGNVSFDKPFQEELNARDSRLKRYRLQQKVKNLDDAIAQIRSGTIAFALISLDNSALQRLNQNPDLAGETVAYDGLAFYVAFSDFQREQSVARVLNGKLSFEQLRQIFTGNNTQFKPYVPTDQAAIDLFEKQVLKPEQYQPFRRLAVDVKQPINRIFEALLKEFEANKTQSIGFGRLSKVFGQCSVYPLAIGEAGQEVQALVQDNGADINPKLDLCNAKGGYWINAEVFEQGRYPLIYRLSIIYAKNKQSSQQPAIAFSKALQTDEGQCLLSEAGLVPLRTIRKTGVCDGIQK